MRCPQCSAEQPGGVTVCGFCGAPMVGGGALAVGPRGAGQAQEGSNPTRRWILLLGVALAVGLTVGWLLRAGARDAGGSESEPDAFSESEAATASAGPSEGEWQGESAVADSAEPMVVRGSGAERMTVERLEAFAEELAALAAEGRSAPLAARVDPRARYRSTTVDAAGRRELDGGKAELLAHWLAPWLAAERAGGLVDELVELQNVEVDADPRQGVLVRRLEAGGDATSIRYPRGFLLPLATRGALAPNETAALDLSPLTESVSRCVTTETLRVAVTPLGPRVIAAERLGLCEP